MSKKSQGTFKKNKAAQPLTRRQSMDKMESWSPSLPLPIVRSPSLNTLNDANKESH